MDPGPVRTGGRSGQSPTLAIYSAEHRRFRLKQRERQGGNGVPHRLQQVEAWLRTPSGVSRRRGPGALLRLQRDFDEAAREPVHANGVSGVGDGFVADVLAGAVVDLLAGIFDQAQNDNQPASFLQPTAHGAN